MSCGEHGCASHGAGSWLHKVAACAPRVVVEVIAYSGLLALWLYLRVLGCGGRDKMLPTIEKVDNFIPHIEDRLERVMAIIAIHGMYMGKAVWPTELVHQEGVAACRLTPDAGV